jgi:L-fuculose-phosphate aldolase
VSEAKLRREIIATALRMNALAINRGKSGNVSARVKGGFLITPTGLAYESTRPGDVVAVTLDGEARGSRLPSSEWRFHRDIYATRSDAAAIVHAHSPFATTLACLGREIPPFHYMIAIAGGKDIRCAPYATFGTQELSDHALKALTGRKACLLANHGMIALESTLARALALAVEIEALAEQYWRALQIAEPRLLSDAEMAVVSEKFRTYGQGEGASGRPRRRRTAR